MRNIILAIILSAFYAHGVVYACDNTSQTQVQKHFKHPEMANDEVFVTNTNEEDFDDIGWKTKRKGKIAYDPSGVPLGNRWPWSFPVFAKKWEIRAKDVEILERLEQEP